MFGKRPPNDIAKAMQAPAAAFGALQADLFRLEVARRQIEDERFLLERQRLELEGRSAGNTLESELARTERYRTRMETERKSIEARRMENEEERQAVSLKVAKTLLAVAQMLQGRRS